MINYLLNIHDKFIVIEKWQMHEELSKLPLK